MTVHQRSNFIAENEQTSVIIENKAQCVALRTGPRYTYELLVHIVNSI